MISFRLWVTSVRTLGSARLDTSLVCSVIFDAGRIMAKFELSTDERLGEGDVLKSDELLKAG